MMRTEASRNDWHGGCVLFCVLTGVFMLCGCPSPPPEPTCGDDVREGTETCDGADDAACPGQCLLDCTCPPPPDPVAPRLYRAVAENGTSVRLLFSEPLADDADNRAHFVIEPPLEIEDAVFGDTPDILYLTTEPQVNSERYLVQVIREDTNGDGLINGDDQILTDIAGNPIEPDLARAEFWGISEEVYAIVDVMVSDDIERRPPADGYTGISFNRCTNPFVPGEIGTQVTGDDVNKGIGGTTTSIWVKYEAIPTTSDRLVVTGIRAQWWGCPWPSNPACPDGWEVASGTSGGTPGALTTGTRDACQCIGLCVRYDPLNTADTFVSSVSFSWGPDSDPTCPALCAANDGCWQMYSDSLDVHRACGDENYLYICYNQATMAPPMPPEIELTEAEKLDLITAYAPRVWLASAERFYPSSVEWAFPYMERFRHSDGNYWLRTRDPLSSPSDSSLTVFQGNRNLAEVPVYAFWVEKAMACGEVADIIYFMYYPYNRGKEVEVIDTMMGNHVGDWEHVSMRLMWQNGEGGWELAPTAAYVSAHDFGGVEDWNTMERVEDTHIVVYAAWGSHGVWLDPGSHVYDDYVVFTLADDCSAGTAWDTWNLIEAFDYNLQVGLGGSTWPLWMGADFTDPGPGPDPSDPANGPIYRWGNTEQDCIGEIDIGVYTIKINECRLNDGPTGPVSKEMWDTELLR